LNYDFFVHSPFRCLRGLINVIIENGSFITEVKEFEERCDKLMELVHMSDNILLDTPSDISFGVIAHSLSEKGIDIWSSEPIQTVLAKHLPESFFGSIDEQIDSKREHIKDI
jgi:hypothetical protein